MAYLWRKSKRESGVKFDIQRDSTSKISHQQRDDALKYSVTEHITDNLVTTLLQKSRLYLEAAKGNLAYNNNNQTLPKRSTLEKGVEGNEGVPTAESPNTLEVVLTTESPIKNKGVTTDEQPTALEGCNNF